MNKQEYGELSSTMASSFKAAGPRYPIMRWVGLSWFPQSAVHLVPYNRDGPKPIRSSLRRQTQSPILTLGPALCLKGEPLAVKHRSLMARSMAIKCLQRCLCVSFTSASASPAPSPTWIAAAALHFASREVRKENVTAHLQRLDCQREEVRQSPVRLACWLCEDKQIWGGCSFSELNHWLVVSW